MAVYNINDLNGGHTKSKKKSNKKRKKKSKKVNTGEANKLDESLEIDKDAIIMENMKKR